MKYCLQIVKEIVNNVLHLQYIIASKASEKATLYANRHDSVTENMDSTALQQICRLKFCHAMKLYPEMQLASLNFFKSKTVL